MNTTNPRAAQFDSLPTGGLVSISTACAVLDKSAPSIYRMFSAGTLTKIKVGGSSKVRVAEIRKLIGGAE
jgi:hypothetical protein